MSHWWVRWISFVCDTTCASVNSVSTSRLNVLFLLLYCSCFDIFVIGDNWTLPLLICHVRSASCCPWALVCHSNGNFTIIVTWFRGWCNQTNIFYSVVFHWIICDWVILLVLITRLVAPADCTHQYTGELCASFTCTMARYCISLETLAWPVESYQTFYWPTQVDFIGPLGKVTQNTRMSPSGQILITSHVKWNNFTQ